MPRSRKYPEELIERGVRLALESGRPIAHVAKDIGLPSETLRKAVRRAEADQGLRPGLPSIEEREEIRKLKRENAELRRGERDPESCVGVLRDRARRRPTEVSAFIEEHRARFGVEPICRTVRVGVRVLPAPQRPALRAAGRGRAADRADPAAAPGQLRVLRVPVGARRAGARGRGRRPGPGGAADGAGRSAGRQAAREAVARNDPRSGHAAARLRTSTTYKPGSPSNPGSSAAAAPTLPSYTAPTPAGHARSKDAASPNCSPPNSSSATDPGSTTTAGLSQLVANSRRSASKPPRTPRDGNPSPSPSPSPDYRTS